MADQVQYLSDAPHDLVTLKFESLTLEVMALVGRDAGLRAPSV